MRGGSSTSYFTPHPIRGPRAGLLAVVVAVAVPLAAADASSPAGGPGKMQVDRVKIPAGPFKRGIDAGPGRATGGDQAPQTIRD